MTRGITNEQAYVLGLLVGGGTMSTATFSIVLPLDKWGANSLHMNEIAKDILTKMQSMFMQAYNVKVSYQMMNKGHWRVHPIESFDISPIVKDLRMLKLPISGQLIALADLAVVKQKLQRLRAENFLSGIFDARASLTESHRRFSNEAPVVSIEVPGSTRNFQFVMQLCSWLTDMQSVTDQILYNHPCQQSAADSTYRGWKKGFKIRFLAKSFISNHSFYMKAKAIDASRLERRQRVKEQLPCDQRACKSGHVSIHRDINSPDLPPEVRNKLFLHFHHICAALGCPHAPYDSVKAIVREAKKHISVFPLLSRGGYDEMLGLHTEIMSSNFAGRSVVPTRLRCSQILNAFQEDYPCLGTGIAYLFCDNLKGKRPAGSQDEIIKNSRSKLLDVWMMSDCAGAPLFLGRGFNKRGIVISSATGEANQVLLKNKIQISGIDINVR